MVGVKVNVTLFVIFPCNVGYFYNEHVLFLWLKIKSTLYDHIATTIVELQKWPWGLCSKL